MNSMNHSDIPGAERLGKCPSCAGQMHQHRFDSVTGGKVDIDVCYDCNAIWFDDLESARLAPDGVVELFSLIHQRGKTSTRPFGERLQCIRCKESLFQVSDMVRSTRFNYRRCPNGHGRLTSFHQFLTEKQFIRQLSSTERAKLVASVRQIKCSSCGAGVDAGSHDACPYCKTPITVLDKEAAEKAVQHYLLMRGKPTMQRPATSSAPAYSTSGARTYGYSPGIDLAADAVSFFAAIAGPRLVAAGLAGLGLGGMTAAGATTPLELEPLVGAATDSEQTRERIANVLDGVDVGTSAIDVGTSVADAASEGLVDGAIDLVGDGISAIFSFFG